MGHLARCRVLASTLKQMGCPCTLIGPSRAFLTPSDYETFENCIELPFASSPEDDAAALIGHFPSSVPALAIIDDYRVEESYQRALKKAGARWLQFNGKPEQPLWADLVLNPSPQADEQSYAQSIRNPGASLLLGPRYALLRPEFEAQEVGEEQAKTTNIFVAFGAGDDQGAVLTVLHALLSRLPDQVHFIVVSGAHNPRNEQITRWVRSHGEGRVALHIAPPCVAQLMSVCDLAIGAGGGTTFEINFFGLPMILIAIAENQITHSQAWQNAGAGLFLGKLPEVDLDALFAAVIQRIDQGSPSPRRTDRLVDGNGRHRVAAAIIDQFQI